MIKQVATYQKKMMMNMSSQVKDKIMIRHLVLIENYQVKNFLIDSLKEQFIL